MTRGQFVIITNNGVYSSCEFNGDMYYEGYGKEVIERLKNVKTVKDFEREVSEFNNENFQYNYDLVLKAQNPIDFSVDYFDNWFSDYLYIKNISNKANIIVDADGKSWKIKPNEIKVFYFGEPTSIKEKSVRKSMKESKIMSFEEFKKLCNDNFGYAIMDFNEYKGAYIVVVSSNEKATELFTKALRKKGLECTFYELRNPNSEYYGCYEIMCV